MLPNEQKRAFPQTSVISRLLRLAQLELCLLETVGGIATWMHGYLGTNTLAINLSTILLTLQSLAPPPDPVQTNSHIFSMIITQFI